MRDVDSLGRSSFNSAVKEGQMLTARFFAGNLEIAIALRGRRDGFSSGDI
jgi:hypothetical protein